MEKPCVSGSGYSDHLWRQYGADRTRPEQHSAGSSEELQCPDGQDLMHAREVIANYINGPTPLGRLTFDQELNIALRRFRLKVDAHMAEEWEKSRRLRAIAGLNRWNQMMARSRESGTTFAQECAAMMLKVRAKLDIQMAVEKIQLQEKVAAHEAKVRKMNDKMIEDKFEAPMAEVYGFGAVLKELKAKVGKNVTYKELSQDVVAIHKKPSSASIANAFDGIKVKFTPELDASVTITEITDQNTQHCEIDGEVNALDVHMNDIDVNVQHARENVLRESDALAGGDGGVVKGPSNGYDRNDGRAASEAIGTYIEKDFADPEIDQDIPRNTGCWAFFSRFFRCFRKKRSNA